MRGELESLSSLSTECCIYRVPKRHRQVNRRAYTPNAVSIGPYHHGKSELQAMEEYKKRYLKSFLERNKISLEGSVEFVKEKEARMRNFYAETIGLSSDDFARMVLVDAAFIVELLFKYNFEELRDENDRVLGKPFMIADLWVDLWLLENQLPFFILDDLSKLSIFSTPDGRKPNIIMLAYNLFKYMGDLNVEKEKLEKMEPFEVLHFLDFVRKCHQPLNPRHKWEFRSLNIPSATELNQSGVKFMVGSSRNLFDIRFNDGVLRIPQLVIGGRSESLFRNLIAYEQCQYKDDLYLNDYLIFVDRLLNSPKDAELLIQHRIVENQLKNSAEVSTLINNMVREAALVPNKFYFSGLCERLVAYSQKPRNKWRATLKQDYFSTPWTVVSTIAAAALLILTLIQTIFSVISP